MLEVLIMFIYIHICTCPHHTHTHTHTHTQLPLGRSNRMFQVHPEQEDDIFIGDMQSDGIVVVEVDPSPTATPETKPKILLWTATVKTPPCELHVGL